MQNNIQEAYVHRSADKKILTFYYDTLRAERDGTTWGIGETKEDSFSKYYAWTGTFESPNTSVLSAVFDASFREFRPTTTAGWFLCFPWLKSIEGLDYLNTSEVTDMSGMFLGCSSLTEIDFSHFDTSQVTNMNGMFMECSSLTALDLSSFNTAKVTNMGAMFSDCSSLTTLDLSTFDTSKVTDMSYMFMVCSNLITLNLSHFDTSKVTTMYKMFVACSSLTEIDLSGFDISQVEIICEMFCGCSALTTIYCNSSWRCDDSEDMFHKCLSLRGAVPYDESQTDVSMANPEKGYFTIRR